MTAREIRSVLVKQVKGMNDFDSLYELWQWIEARKAAKKPGRKSAIPRAVAHEKLRLFVNTQKM